MKYFLGIDGGGTKTAFTLIDENNNIIKQVTLGPSSIDTVSFDECEKVLREGIKSFDYKIEACFAGLGGMCGGLDIGLIESMLLKYLPNCKCVAGSDTENALFGALNSNDGICVICGTGSAAFGKWNNKSSKVGGYGYTEGDPGSSYSLGLDGMRYLARVLDGCYEETPFSKELSEVSECYSREDIVYYFKSINRTNVAHLSRIVTKYQHLDICKKIIMNSVDGLVEEIIGVYNNLHVDKECMFSIVGSLGNADTFFKEYLLECLNKKLPLLKYVPYIYNADMGSALKAKELI